MTDKKPTQEQIISANQKLNEQCGTEGINFYEGDTALGFLFLYAVPKAIETLMVKNTGWTELRALRYLFQAWLIEYQRRKSTLGDALFWIIWKIWEVVK